MPFLKALACAWVTGGMQSRSESTNMKGGLLLGLCEQKSFCTQLAARETRHFWHALIQINIKYNNLPRDHRIRFSLHLAAAQESTNAEIRSDQPLSSFHNQKCTAAPATSGNLKHGHN